MYNTYVSTYIHTFMHTCINVHKLCNGLTKLEEHKVALLAVLIE